MATSIGSSQKDNTNFVACQTLAKIYGTDQEIKEAKRTFITSALQCVLK